MKTLFFSICMLFSAVLFAQDQSLNSLLQNEEATLYSLQEKRNQMVNELQLQGINPQENLDVKNLDIQIKGQNAKVRALRKEINKQERLARKEAAAAARAQAESTGQPAPQAPKKIKLPKIKKNKQAQQPETQQPRVKTPKVKKAKPSLEEKELIREIRGLKSRRSQLANQAIEQGQDPKYSPSVQMVDEAILQKERKLQQLQANRKTTPEIIPVVTSPAPTSTNTPVVVQQPKPTKVKAPRAINTEQTKALKKQLKNLKKRKRELERRAIIEGRNPTTSPEIVVVNEQIAIKKAEIIAVTDAQPVVAEQPVIAPTTPSQPVLIDPVPRAEDTMMQKPIETVQAPEQPTIAIPSIGLSTILFQKFSTEINTDYDLYLNYVAKQLQENPALLLKVSAYTDNSEKQRISMQLTAGMANSVRQAFMKRGIPPQRIILDPQGSRNNLGDNKTLLGQSRNRRVELSFTTS